MQLVLVDGYGWCVLVRLPSLSLSTVPNHRRLLFLILFLILHLPYLLSPHVLLCAVACLPFFALRMAVAA